ncbi:hypothetical protein BRADI_1g19290v3 [Brachypodium distachyon]|uniref:Protein kinase domain-containing protein n=1 Tax=Brachypodium distachyon TaxID=15368 RepID=A0A2K2DK35_BRADI|nr:hypothetical protein BRADI_1g19290v3 [Brachypodium distachyon]
MDGNNRHLLKLERTNLGRFGGRRPFLLSPLRNVVIGVGWDVQPEMAFGRSIDNETRYMIGCLSYIKHSFLTNGSCSGRGCCEASIPSEKDVDFSIRAFTVVFEPQKERDMPGDDMSTNSPCSYAMMVERSWYNFSSEDMFGRMVLPNKYPRGVPFVLDFAIRNRSCTAQGQQPPQDYACISGNSYCAKAPSGNGYVCRCQDNYDGNPYITNGCQDINECDLHPKNNCSAGSFCKNTPGGYECPCKVGMKGNGKKGPCTENFPMPAKVIVGVSSSIVVVVLMLMVNQFLKLKKFYEQNGGPILKGVKNIRIYTRKQLKQITGNYKHPIGEGAFGKVYLGTLEDKQQVAIKRSIKVEKERTKEFTDEVIIQSEMRHKNIVRLLSCCLEVDVPILVYEFVPRGSLYEVLFRGGDSIPVNTRLRIAVGTAEGLAYMHSAGQSTIRHGDVKSANILLDEIFIPKVSDFGTSSLLARGTDEMTENVIGDKSYIDPIYMQEGIVTQKSDVYSFGVVLIELVTRRAAKYDKERSYIKNFVQACLGKRAREFFDNDITSDEDIKILEMVSEVAVECLKTNPEERLHMRQVESRLFYISAQSVHYGQETNDLRNLSPSPEDIALPTSGENEASTD